MVYSRNQKKASKVGTQKIREEKYKMMLVKSAKASW